MTNSGLISDSRYLDSSHTPCEVQMYVATETSAMRRRVSRTTMMSAERLPARIESMIRARESLVDRSSLSETPTSMKLSSSESLPSSLSLSPVPLLLVFFLPLVRLLTDADHNLRYPKSIVLGCVNHAKGGPGYTAVFTEPGRNELTRCVSPYS